MEFFIVLIVHCTSVFFLLQLAHCSLFLFFAHLLERIGLFAIYIAVSLITFRFTKMWCLQDTIDLRRKAVLITGCDYGFGYLLARRLDRKGIKVFASCLSPCGAGATELKKILSENSKVFGLDVTKQESVLHALKYVKKNLGSCELWAVVNNAGVRKGFSMELSSLQDFEDCMDVNAMGHVRIIKAFLSLLRQTKGRIVNVNSISSRIPVADIIPYCMSKHAAAGFNDCLRAELANTGIKVISIEASAFLSPMTDSDIIKKNLAEKIDENEGEITKHCGKDYIRNYRKFCNFFLSTVSKDVNIAINDLEHAVCSKYPEIIYNTCPSIFRVIWLKIQAILPPFMQDTVYLTVPRIVNRLHGL